MLGNNGILGIDRPRFGEQGLRLLRLARLPGFARLLNQFCQPVLARNRNRNRIIAILRIQFQRAYKLLFGGIQIVVLKLLRAGQIRVLSFMELAFAGRRLHHVRTHNRSRRPLAILWLCGRILSRRCRGLRRRTFNSRNIRRPSLRRGHLSARGE
jgi:hypothetical protein